MVISGTLLFLAGCVADAKGGSFRHASAVGLLKLRNCQLNIDSAEVYFKAVSTLRPRRALRFGAAFRQFVAAETSRRSGAATASLFGFGILGYHFRQTVCGLLVCGAERGKYDFRFFPILADFVLIPIMRRMI